ncbi:MAG: vWA domain-containing protein [Desulfitobacterium sp.]
MERSELDRHLLEFIRLLREGGISVSLTEVQDALQGLTLIGMADKSQVEGVLQSTLVKSVNQLPWFQEVFRVFFATPEAQSNWQKEAQEKAESWEKGMAETRKELRFQGEELELTDEQRATYMSLPENEKERLKKFLERSEEGVRNGIPVDHSFQPVVEKMFHGSLEYWKRKLGEDFLIAPPGQEGLLSEVERAVRQKEMHYLTKDLKDIPPEEWPEVSKLIRRLSRSLASQVSRRLRQGKRGSLDMRRTVRENLRYGGVLIKKNYRKKRKGKPKFVLICDLSGSMVKYTEFILQFIYGLTSLVAGIETYVFASHLVDIRPRIRGGIQSFQGMVNTSLTGLVEEFGGGTNLAVSLEELHEQHGHSLSRRTVLFILSDAQTLEGEKAAVYLKKTRRKVREIIWLNTLPEKRWKDVKSIDLFRPYCQMFECNTLEHLQDILKKSPGFV